MKLGKDEYLTPPEIIKALGDFDMDPCCPEKMPWPTAKRQLTKSNDGLKTPWFGRIWLNPPYGRETQKWLKKLAIHRNGIALIFSRTDTDMFHNWVWCWGDAILFIKGRISFYNTDGQKYPHNSGAPSCLVAYGKDNAVLLKESGIKGFYLDL